MPFFIDLILISIVLSSKGPMVRQSRRSVQERGNALQDIQGDNKTLEVLLSGSAIGIDYYQREYQPLLNRKGEAVLAPSHIGHPARDPPPPEMQL